MTVYRNACNVPLPPVPAATAVVLRTFLLAGAALILSACGGGGGDSTPPPTPAPTVSLSASPTQVASGASATLTWSSSNATSCTASGGWSGNRAVSGSEATPALTADASFTLTCTGAGGSTARTAQVTVAAPAAPTVTLTANPTQVMSGATTALTWSSTNADSCTASGGWSGARATAGTETSAAITAATTFTLTCDGPGGQASDSADVTLAGTGGGMTTVTGKITFDRVPHAANNGLDYNATRADPVRGATVQLVGATGQVLATGKTDAAGDYALEVATGTSVRVRVLAEMLETGTPSWNFVVVDNTANDALYTLDGALATASGATDTRNLLAASGWTGASYTQPRAAGPFAILDSVYDAFTDLLTVDAALQFPPLTLHWSENNRPVSGNQDIGEITTSFYTRTAGGDSQIFLLGQANTDSDEYDRHVVIHEWGHYFEDRFSRSDSMGGPHSGGDRLDPRIAFSEGFGYALAGMVTDDPNAADSFGQGQAQGFAIDVETDASSNLGGTLNPGWFSEGSIWLILYDLYDAQSDAADSVTLGLAPIINTLRSPAFAQSTAATTIFSFAEALRAEDPSVATGLNALLNAKDIVGTGNDRYGSAETNDASNPTAGAASLPDNFNAADMLPVYTQITPNGQAQVVCSVGGQGQRDFGVFNKLGNRQLLRFTVGTAGRYRMAVSGTQDPDIVLFQGDFLAVSQSIGNDAIDRDLTPGEYILEVYDYANIRPEETSHAAARYCLTVTVTPI